ncbi:ABC transporter permease [Actinotalea ferrariae]|uniref:ABC transporter permease n=1 Tax=Actinotalea ferrariae TaxID=1386098 RepID=UPI001C8C9582|nr:ABC transporter permease [Actinotalea ferrariae]MBX9244711.1 ABC transporter permease [Actinotalea ferrariae]
MSATHRTPSGALRRLTLVEGRLLVRERGTAFFGLLFPGVLLTVLGLVMPWADEPFDAEDPVLSQITAITAYAPIVLTLAIGTAALSTFPTVLGTYRDKGVLRRLSTTPVPPSYVLVAQLLVALASIVFAAVLAVVLGAAVLGIGMPTRPLLVVAAFVLGATSALALGCLIAARARTAGAATAAGMVAWVASMFFAGVWLPLPLMPEIVRTLSSWTPVGAASQAMAAGWYGVGVPLQELLVMAGWTAVCVPLAARFFRWS